MRFRALRFGAVVALISAAVANDATAVEPMGSTFTYQGQLKSEGVPVDGTVDLKVWLFDVESGGVSLDLVELDNVAVTNGLFNVELDFGAGVFNGDARWLEIAVRSPLDPGDTEAFTTLAPRQPITATPYALQTRGLFVDDAGSVGVGETNPQATLHLGGAAGIDGLMFPDGTLQTTAAIGGGGTGSIWSESVDVFNNDIFYTSGNVGIGTESSGSRLHVTTPFSGAILAESSNPSGIAVEGRSTATTDGPAWGGLFSSASPLGRGVFAHATASIGNTVGGLFLSGSSVGKGVFGQAYASSGVNYGVHGQTNSDEGYAGYFVGGRNYFEGNVGFGTEAPLYPVHAEATTGDAVFGKATGSLGVAVHGRSESTSGIGVFGFAPATSGSTYGVYGRNKSVTGRGVYGLADHTSGTNYGVYGKTSSINGYAGYFVGGRNYFQGNVGIGTTTPASPLSVVGDVTSLDGAGVETIRLDASTGSTGGGAILVRNEFGVTTVEIEGSEGNGGGSYIKMWNSDAVQTIELDADEVNGGAIRMKNLANHTTIELLSDIGGEGRVICDVLQIKGGSDLSEQFDVSSTASKIEPGMVVSIDPANAGKLMVSKEAYDNKVAGIISGAGGVKPGLLMGQKGSIADGQYPVALTGRVWCRVDASFGNIFPGDLLTTSNTPGHAMKAGDADRARGAVIGKAMTQLEEGTGLVLVLVQPQ